MDPISTLAGVGQSLWAFFQLDPALLADPEVGVRLALQVVLLAGSAFFSGSETALFSLSRLDLHKLNRERHPRSATLHALLDSPRKLIISILCGNEIINIAAVANMTALLVLLYGPERAGILSIVIMVPLLLVVGEITPKIIAVSNPVRVSAGLVAAPLSRWVRLITPVRWALRGVADRITTWIVGEERAAENILRLDEFRSIVDEVASEGELHATERSLIYQLLDAGATEIVEIMTPRTRVAFIEAGQSAADMIAQFRAIRHSRVPVYQNHPDNLIGFMRIETVLPLVMEGTDPAGVDPEDLVSPPIVVPPTKKVDEMFDFFRTNNARAAVVLNEFGGVEGIITLRDVLTFIFGHLSGEIRGQELYTTKDEDVYEVPGDMRLVDFNNLTNFAIHDPRMTTIGGVAFRHLDRLPRVGDEVVVEGYTLTVLEVAEQRIIRLRVARQGTPPASASEAT
ncbi:hemolysin family protein [Thiohalobacter thiocyanaticus]|uniref:HlyC/CorC family transporter n=1 Tax=Thiohalobacter thiocyanaticus TaxID=585455 RepID=A0A426QIJ6_9GAMM|nr:hemolysin family protein [Thiohalobacter thiocyanaticus]RRQ21579.1 HlyC/CorC family transporter [Thiohalobacter thiocyanaticus]